MHFTQLLITNPFSFNWCMFIDESDKLFSPYIPHIIWIRIQTNIIPWHLLKIKQKVFFLEVFELPCLNGARTGAIIMSFSCHIDKIVITDTKGKDT